MSDFPPSSDMCAIGCDGEGRPYAFCLICNEYLGEVNALNNALVLWRDHREAMAPKVQEEGVW